MNPIDPEGTMPHDPLVDFLKARTRRSFAALVDWARSDVLNAAYRVLGDRDLAEDTAQEVFVRLLTAKWDPEKIRSGKAILAAQAIRTSLVKLRSEDRRSRRERRSAAGSSPPSGETEEVLDRLLDVREAVRKLPDELRSTVELRYFGGLALEEVSKALQLSLTTIKERLKRAREVLKGLLAPTSAALALAALAGESAAAWPSIEPSPALEERLGALMRDGPSMARAAGAAAGPSSGASRMLIACGLVVFAGGGASLWLWRPWDRSGIDAPPVQTLVSSRAAGVERPRQKVAPEEPPASGSVEKTATPATISGPAAPYRVLDAEGKPLAEVEVALVEGERVVITNSDAGGRFGFPEADLEAFGLGSAGRNPWLAARKEGYYGYERVLLYRPLPGFELKLERAREATVRVLREHDRSPVRRYRLTYEPLISSYGNARVGKWAEFLGGGFEAEVDDVEGVHRFTPKGYAWNQEITVNVPGSPPMKGEQFRTAETYERGEVVFLLSIPQPIAGRVVDSQGNAVPGAEVHSSNGRQPIELNAKDWSPEGNLETRGAARTICDADGRFTIPSLPHETWLVARHGTSVPAVMRLKPPYPREPLRLVLDQGGGLRIRRLDGSDLPVGGERVTLHLIDGEAEPGWLYWQLRDFLAVRLDQNGVARRTDSDGLASFDGLLPGVYHWMERKARLVVKPGERTELTDRDPLQEADDASTAPKARVFGRILIGGEAKAGVRIHVAHKSATTDAEGRYEVRDVAPGRYFIQSPNNYAGLPGQNSLVPFEVVPAMRELELNWNFALCEIRGRIVSPDGGAPPAGAKVKVLKISKESYRDVLASPMEAAAADVDAEGRFSHRHLTTGTYFLVVRVPGHEVETVPFDIAEDAPAVLSFELRMTPSRSTFTLRMSDSSSGERLSPSDYSLVRRGDGLSLAPDNFPPGPVDRLEWNGLPPGVYDYGVLADFNGPFGFAYGTVEVAGKGRPIEASVAIPGGGGLLVEVKDASGRRFAEPMPAIELRRADGGPAAAPCRFFRHADIQVHRKTCEEPAEAWFPHLPAGLYQAAVTRRGFLPRMEAAEVRRGDVTRLMIELTR